MSDGKLSSSNNYTIGNVSGVSTDTNIIKRPYNNIPSSNNKKQNKSNSFKDTLNSIVSHDSDKNDSNDFAEIFDNKLNDINKLENTVDNYELFKKLELLNSLKK